jgi:D-alanyl-lipoteichoic acid acyltransferase DltB (MBOAT superfamily)
VLFPTITFAIFFVAVFVVSWLLMPRLRVWKVFIVLAGCVFYGWWDYRAVALLAVVALANFALALAIARARGLGARKTALVVALSFDLGLLAVFKYFDFFAVSAANLFRVFGLQLTPPLLDLALPVGISFLTFRIISYVVDVYRGTLEPASLLDVAVYVAFFPYLLAGPIARASEFLPQLRRPRDPRRIDASRAFFLIFAGLVKKMLIADYVASHLVTGVFTTPGRYTSLETLLGIYGYAVQIYCDFSAYSDMAIGLALLLGFELPDNFNAPYTARDVRDFWRRWHMTLSSWIRDYLYIPFGGNRKGARRTYVNLVGAMLLAGLWHGAAWTFVFWGGLHGAGLCGDHWRVARRRTRGEPDLREGFWAVARQRFLTFQFVAFAWVFLPTRADFASPLAVLSRLFTAWGSVGSNVTLAVVLVIALGIAIQYVPARAVGLIQVRFSRLSPAAQGVGLALAFFVLNVVGPQGPAAFLYFRF